MGGGGARRSGEEKGEGEVVVAAVQSTFPHQMTPCRNERPGQHFLTPASFVADIRIEKPMKD